MHNSDKSEIPHPDEIELIRERFKSFKQWTRRGKRAPHKPLLSLLAISRCLKGIDRLTTFEDVRGELLPLLREFAPYSPSPRPEHPFWRMKNDRIWEIPDRANVTTTTSGDASAKYMRENRTAGGFPEKIFDAFRNKPEFAISLARELVEAHFPETLHERIFEAVGMSEAAIGIPPDKRKIWVQKSIRDSKFREQVLSAYGNSCAVCSYSVRIRNDLVGLEAAHIKWHQLSGPDIVQNGIALCSIHHKLFDGGAFTLEPGKKIKVSDFTSGKGRTEWLDRYKGEPLQMPSDVSQSPSEEFLKWHRRDVFKGPMFTK